MRHAWTSLIAALLVGCAAGSSAVLVPAAEVSQRQDAESIAELSYLPTLGRRWDYDGVHSTYPVALAAHVRVAGGSDGDVVTLGAVRARVRGDRLEVARDAFTTEIVYGGRLDRGWVFVARDGLVARATDALSRLERIADTPTPLTHVAPSRGRLAIVDGWGALWITDGGDALHRADELPPPGTAIAAAFADAAFGVVVLDGGSLVATADGGARWETIPLGGVAAYDVTPEPDSIRVSTSRGDLRLGRDRSVAAASGQWPVAALLSASDTGRVEAATIAAFPGLAGILGAVSRDGTHAIVLHANRTIAVDVPTGRVVDQVDAQGCVGTASLPRDDASTARARCHHATGDAVRGSDLLFADTGRIEIRSPDDCGQYPCVAGERFRPDGEIAAWRGNRVAVQRGSAAFVLDVDDGRAWPLEVPRPDSAPCVEPDPRSLGMSADRWTRASRRGSVGRRRRGRPAGSGRKQARARRGPGRSAPRSSCGTSARASHPDARHAAWLGHRPRRDAGASHPRRR